MRLATYLHEQDISVSVVNPLAVKRFAQFLLLRTKTDKKDTEMIRKYGIRMSPDLWKSKEKIVIQLLLCEELS